MTVRLLGQENQSREKCRNCSRELKLAEVKAAIEHCLSYAVVAGDLGVGAHLIRNWKKSFEADSTFGTEASVKVPN